MRARRAVPRRTLSGRALSGRALSGRALPGRARSGRALPGRALSGRALSGRALPGRALRTACAVACVLAVAGVADVAGVAVVGGVAQADPLFEPPVLGKGRWGGEDGDALVGGLVLDVRILGIVGTERLAFWPDRQLGLEPKDPIAAALRVGGVLHSTGAPWSFVLQADLAEALRPGFAGERPWTPDVGAWSGALVDDAYVMWRPSRVAHLVLGRARVPVTKWRQYDERDVALGAVPFVVDRVAPDRRWGLLFEGDLGALSYAAGAWEDVDALEPRAAEDDPYAGGRYLGGVQLEWTPIAPMMASIPVGKVAGARGPLPTPRADPWFDTARVSLGLGALWRQNARNVQRLDASVSLQWKWRWLAALGEALLVDSTHLGATAELAATPFDAVSLHLRGEVDPGEARATGATDAAWTLGAGAMWHATADRRSRIGIFAWLRRVDLGASRERSEDAAIVLLQTAL
jgi:hypothetical protein